MTTSSRPSSPTNHREAKRARVDATLVDSEDREPQGPQQATQNGDGSPCSDSSDSFEDHCSICLHQVVDRTIVPICSHEFCFECLIIWCDQSRRCPLCSQDIRDHVIHQIRSSFDYQKHFLPPLKTNSPKPLQARGTAIDHRRASTRRRRERRWGRQEDAAHREADRLELSIAKRRWIYANDLYAKHVASNAYTRYRAYPTPAQFAASPDMISRVTIFLRRELRVWVNLDVEFLTTYIISVMKAIDIRSESTVKLLAEFLDMDGPYVPGARHRNAEHFAHEVYSFTRSPYKDLFVYDGIVQYDVPPDIQPLSEPSSQQFWEDESDLNHAGPSRRRSRSPLSSPSSPHPRASSSRHKHRSTSALSGSPPIRTESASQPQRPSRDESWSPSGRTYPPRNAFGYYGGSYDDDDDMHGDNVQHSTSSTSRGELGLDRPQLSLNANATNDLLSASNAARYRANSITTDDRDRAGSGVGTGKGKERQVEGDGDDLGSRGSKRKEDPVADVGPSRQEIKIKGEARQFSTQQVEGDAHATVSQTNRRSGVEANTKRIQPRIRRANFLQTVQDHLNLKPGTGATGIGSSSSRSAQGKTERSVASTKSSRQLDDQEEVSRDQTPALLEALVTDPTKVTKSTRRPASPPALLARLSDPSEDLANINRARKTHGVESQSSAPHGSLSGSLATAPGLNAMSSSSIAPRRILLEKLEREKRRALEPVTTSVFSSTSDAGDRSSPLGVRINTPNQPMSQDPRARNRSPSGRRTDMRDPSTPMSDEGSFVQGLGDGADSAHGNTSNIASRESNSVLAVTSDDGASSMMEPSINGVLSSRAGFLRAQLDAARRGKGG